MLIIDGSMGEGGGQILRSALALSLCLMQPFHIFNIRAARKMPGLRTQHLAAVNAAAAVGDADVTGATLGSRFLEFAPRRVKAGNFNFDIGTAGSTILVLQTILPALLTATTPSRITMKGGTHNPLAPSFDFFIDAFAPLINRMGPRLTAHMSRHGFYPIGGGIIEVSIEPAAALSPLAVVERGAVLSKHACATISRLPDHIAERELSVIGKLLKLSDSDLELCKVDAGGPGNTVALMIKCEQITELFSGIGQRGKRAETVAEEVVMAVQRYLAAGVPVAEHLADQLLLPLALAGSGFFITLEPSSHTTTNIEVIEQFTHMRFTCEELGHDRWRIGC